MVLGVHLTAPIEVLPLNILQVVDVAVVFLITCFIFILHV